MKGKKCLDPYLTPYQVNSRRTTVLHVTDKTTKLLEKKIGGLHDLELGKEGVKRTPNALTEKEKLKSISRCKRVKTVTIRRGQVDLADTEDPWEETCNWTRAPGGPQDPTSWAQWAPKESRAILGWVTLHLQQGQTG